MTAFPLRIVRWFTRRIRPRAVSTLESPGRVHQLAANLEAEKKALEAFTAATEDEFLTLGSLLRRITKLARDIRARSDEVITAAAGHTEDAAIQFAFQLLKKAEDLVRASREQHANVTNVFGKIHADLGRIAREREALMRTLSPLAPTTTQFRIQACAFDESTRARFFVLAESISEIVRDVQLAVGRRFEELEQTGKASGELVANLTMRVAEQNRETERMLDDTRSHLSTLNAALRCSEAAAESISQSGAKIAGGVANAIVALQCQDMARQKFQHIGNAMDEMIGHLAAGMSEGFQGAAERDAQRFLGDAGRVQLSQVRNVFSQLDEAAGQLSRGLEEVEAESGQFAASARQAGNATLDGRVTGQAIESIHAVLAVIESAVAGIAGVLELVARLRSTFNDCTAQILGLALSLRRVALNAQIFAAHVDGGTALEVVARNTRIIADEAMEQIDLISLRVTGLVNAVVDLEHRLRDYRELALIEQNLLSKEAAESEQRLCGLEKNLRKALGAIGPLERELAQAICDSCAQIRFPARVSEVSARCTTFFEGLIREYGDPQHAAEASPHSKVEALKRNYTMAHERVVHEQAVDLPPAFTAERQLEPAPDELGAAAIAGENEEKLADNVELF